MGAFVYLIRASVPGRTQKLIMRERASALEKTDSENYDDKDSSKDY